MMCPNFPRHQTDQWMMSGNLLWPCPNLSAVLQSAALRLTRVTRSFLTGATFMQQLYAILSGKHTSSDQKKFNWKRVKYQFTERQGSATSAGRAHLATEVSQQPVSFFFNLLRHSPAFVSSRSQQGSTFKTSTRNLRRGPAD